MFELILIGVAILITAKDFADRVKMALLIQVID